VAAARGQPAFHRAGLHVRPRPATAGRYASSEHPRKRPVAKPAKDVHGPQDLRRSGGWWLGGRGVGGESAERRLRRRSTGPGTS